MFSLKKKDKKGINLAPEEEKSAGSGKNVFTTGLLAGGFVVVIVGISLILVSLNVSKSIEAGNLEELLSERLSSWNQLAPLAQQSSDLKTKLVKHTDLRNSNNNFKQALEMIRKYVPNQVQLSSLTLDTGTSLKLQATAASPANLYQFAEELDKQGQFFESVEIDSLVKTEEEFVLSLSIKTRSQ